MNRETLRIAVIALLCCAAVILAAATLPSMVEVGGSGGAGPPGGGEGPDVGESESPNVTEFGDRERNAGDSGFELPDVCIGLLDGWWGFPGLLLVTLGIAYLATRRYDPAVTVVVAVGLVPFVLVLYVLLTSGCGDPSFNPIDTVTGGNESAGGGGGGDGDGDLTAPRLLSFLVLVTLVVGVIAGAIALFHSTGSTSREPEQSTDEPEPDARRAAVGRAAGRAADRIEETEDFENEVYRAWREMTEPLDVDRPASSTAGEFAAAAREAGVDAEHVDELTRLFEEVRYGGRAATDERERRAVETLRRIEAAYGGDPDE